MQKEPSANAGIAVLLLCSLAACSAPSRLEAVPATLHDVPVQLPDVSGSIRYRVGNAESEAALANEFGRSWERERQYLTSHGHSGPLPPVAFLALSGGGDKGAFAAGLLNGWTASGTRPQFKLVTGISTGALIAPFAFLGPPYDAKLKAFYTSTSSKDILKARSLLVGLTGDAMADSEPLRRLLSKQVDRAFLDAVAAEYTKGRELWIATTNLDNLQRYIWNMTRIASSRDSAAQDLFVSLMLASAAIPGAFPPVLVDVEVDGRKYQEMHVDGGTMAQVFVYPIGLDFRALADEYHAGRERTLYVVRNARLDPEWAQIERRTLSIAARAISSLIQTQGLGDLYRIYLAAERDGLDFNLAYIPASFKAPHREQFDTEYMRALFNVGYELAVKGYPWEKTPPSYSTGHHSSERLQR
jgi:predicted acylesterase/phospholipase RssA